MKWANTLAGDDNKDILIKDLKDKSLANGRLFLHILSKIDPSMVNQGNILQDESDEAKHNNAKYFISTARKMGGQIDCTW